MIPLTDAWLNVYRPGRTRVSATGAEADPDLVVEGGDRGRIVSLEYTERIGHRKDSGTLTVANDDGALTGVDLWADPSDPDPEGDDDDDAPQTDPISAAPRAQTAIRAGDRLELVITTGAEILSPWANVEDPEGYGDYAGYGDGEYGAATTPGGVESADEWGDKTWAGNRFQWSAMVNDVSVITHNPSHIDIEVKAEDFVFSVASDRLVYNSFRDRTVAGILTAMLTENAPDINWYISTDGELGKRIDATFDGTPLFDAIGEMLREGDAIARGYRDLLTVTPFQAPRRRFTVQNNDFSQIQMTERSDELANVVRVDGARALALDPFSVEDAYGTSSLLTQDHRRYVRLGTRKSEVGALDVWMRRNQGSSDNVTVRLQPDDGTGEGPIAENDAGSDLAQRTLAHHFLADGTWTRFLMPGHDLNEPRPWAIIETSGEDGHYVGMTPTGTVMHRVLFPFNIAVSDRDPGSVATFRRRDARLKAQRADATEARLRAARHLAHHSQPAKEATVKAASERMHMLRPGDVIGFNQPRSAIVGEYIVTERSDNFATGENKISLDTTLTVRDVKSV